MARIKSVCVYCGSRRGVNSEYAEAARRFGRLLGESGIRLVYGGGRIGLMGVCADATLEAGGQVLGVIPHHLDSREVGHRGVDLRVVPSMHVRKQMMFEESDAFIVLPGGIGTMDEFFEILTWRQLGVHDKPVLLVNIGGYFEPLLNLLHHMIEQDLAGHAIRRLYEVVEDIDDILPALKHAPEPATLPQAAKI